MRKFTPAQSNAGTLPNLEEGVEGHHRSVGAFLKFVEGAIAYLRYTHHPADPKVGKALDNITKAIQNARPVLDYQYSYWAGKRPGGDVYYGDEVHALHRIVYGIEGLRYKHQQEIKFARAMGRDRVPLPDGGTLKYTPPFDLAEGVKKELDSAIADVFIEARQQPQLLPGNPPPALAARHASIAADLIANPDQSQAALVRKHRCHPDTIRRTRRELEEAGKIPFLAHRHAQSPAPNLAPEPDLDY
jgi:hypothetical protein